MRVVHLPKTIDNDYRGIDFTFGFFTAVDVMAKELQNLRADAIATSSYFLVETMGRKAGWLGVRRGDRGRGEPGARGRGRPGRARDRGRFVAPAPPASPRPGCAAPAPAKPAAPAA